MISTYLKRDGGTLRDLRNHILRLNSNRQENVSAVADVQPARGLAKSTDPRERGPGTAGQEWRHEPND